MTAIDLVALSKTFGSVAAVKDLTLAVADKEFVALLGPSGCGKTTTMNMIAGIETPTSGQILFDGVDVSKLPPPKRNIGFVFQNYAIFTHMSVRENLAFALQVRGVPRSEVKRRVAEMAELMRLGEHLDRRAASLSVNEMQKLAIGRSAIGRPAIFLLDEPLSNVDAAFRVFMRSELKHIQRELQQTMVYVTHDQTEAMSLADRIAVMHKGLLQQVGTPEEVYNRPANTFVARFMGSPPMNLLPARLAQSDGTTHLTCAGSRIAIDPATLARLGRAGELLLGIRPEHIELAAADDPREGLVLSIDMVEPVGPRVIVHLGKDGAVKAVASKRSGATAGQLAKAILPVTERRYFDAAGGQAIGAAHGQA
jgi:multiple sugar transport system ATP-binding protein